MNSLVKDEELTKAGSVFKFDLSDLEVSDPAMAKPSPTPTPADPTAPVPEGPIMGGMVQPTINISTEQLSQANLTDISSGNTEEAEAMLKQVDNILAGLDAFEGSVTNASSELQSEKSQNLQVNKNH